VRKEKWKMRREERGERGKHYSFGATRPLLGFQLSSVSFAAEEVLHLVNPPSMPRGPRLEP